MIKEKKGELKKNCCKTTILSLRAKLVDAPSIGGGLAYNTISTHKGYI